MKQKMPNSPFTTHLSGSAKEVELRLRNIFQWKKKRPPVTLLVLAALVALSCGGLVSCQPSGQEPPVDGNIISDVVVKPEELAAASGQDDLFPTKIQMLYLPWETKILQEPMESLTQEQRDLLADLPVDELPREPVELSNLLRGKIWRDTLIPLAADEENDVTLYGVVSVGRLPDMGSRAAVNSQLLDVDGIVLRHGNQAVYYPLSWGSNAWRAGNPWMSVRDFDGDGKVEAAVCLYASHGTGRSIENLYFFNLDTLTYTVPDYSAFGEIEAAHDLTAHTVTLTMGAESLTVEVSTDLEPYLREGQCGEVVQFYEENGRIDCRVGLDFYGTVAYLAYATAPVIWQDGGYCLGEIALSANDAY